MADRIGVIRRATLALTGAWLAACGAGASASASSPMGQLGGLDAFDDEEPHVAARLVSEHGALIAGEVNALGVVFDIREGWHIYGDALNDTGFPTKLEVHAPEGYTVGETVYPAPERYISPGDILDHVYEDRVLLIVPVEVPEDARAGERVTLTASAEWLVCKEACIPGWDEDLSITLPVVASAGSASRTPDAGLFEQTRRAVPMDIADASPAPTVQWTRGSLVVTAHDAAQITFMPGSGSARLADPINGASAEGERLILRPNPNDAREDDNNAKPPLLEGVLAVRWNSGDAPRYYSFRSASHPPVAMPGG